MNKRLQPQLRGCVGTDLADLLQRKLPRQDHRVRSHGVEDVGGGAVDHTKLRADMQLDLRRKTLGQRDHAQIGNDQRVGSDLLQIRKVLRQPVQLFLPRQGVAGDIDLLPPLMGQGNRPLQRLVIEISRGGSHTEFLPREVDGIRAIAQRHLQPLPIPGRGEQLKVVTNNPV